MKRHYFTYGLAAGLLLTVYVTMLDRSRIIYTSTWGAYLGYLAILILPACIYLALHETSREKRRLFFRQSLMVSLVVAFLAASIYSAYTFADIHFFGATHLQNLYDYTEQGLKDEGRSMAEIQARMNRMREHYLSFKPYLYTYTWYLVMGLIYSVIFFFVFKLRYRRQLS